MRDLLIKAAIVLAFSICGADGAQAAITYDTNETGYNVSTVSAFTLGSGTDRIVFGAVWCESMCDVSAMTFDGEAMTKVDEIDVSSNNTVAVFYILDADLPVSAGDYVISATVSGSPVNLLTAGISFFGVAQEAPEANVNASSTSTQVQTIDITTLTDSAWVIDFIVAGDYGSYTVGANQVERRDYAVGSTMQCGMSTREVASAGLVTNSWTHSDPGVNRQAIIAVSMAPAGAAGGSTIAESAQVTGDVTFYGDVTIR